MAAAVIANQNESNWAHMGKIPYHLNGNPNPNKKPKHNKSVANGDAGHYRELPAVAQTASDDAYSFNQASTSADASNYSRYLTYNVSVYTKYEVLELRKRLITELEQIKDFQNRIDSGHFSNVANPRSLSKSKKHSVKERPVAALGSIQGRQGHGFNEQSFGNVDFGPLLKECSQVLTKLLRTKCAYVFKAPVDVVGLKLHDYYQIVRHPMDLGTVKRNLAKNMYPTPREFAADVRLTFNNALLYNPKLDPVHKFAAEMSARFEELFSPIQQKVDSCFKQRREVENQEIFRNEDYQFQTNDELRENSWSNNHNQSLEREKVKKHKPSQVHAPQVSKMVDRMQMPMQTHSSASTSSDPPPTVLNHQPKEEPISSPVRAPLQDQKAARSGGFAKQPKPKAKDPNKREMFMEEKQKLGIGLQSLPQEKMPQLVQIIRKRNDHLAADGDEIELDIETLDTETLWELDRFVTNWKKMASKSKRQAVVMNNDLPDVIEAPLSPMADANADHISDNNDNSPQKLKDNDEEDVDVDIDIDDDMPETSFPPVMIEKDEGAGTVLDNGQDQNHDGGGNASSSSSGSGSSSSDSSSSSGSSSGSDSDADEAQS